MITDLEPQTVEEAEGKGWFLEVNNQWPHQALGLEFDSILFDDRSDFQHVRVIHNKIWGNVLLLDGVIQLTEKDEMAYHEMIVHLPLFSHPKPESVLVIGGGDGGSVREILKHKMVKEVIVCEIDQMVLDTSQKFFPQLKLKESLQDPRVKIVYRDASQYIKEQKDRFDIIIVDSTDPAGPAATLFELPFYNAMFHALHAGGKICTQAECIWLNLDLISKLIQENSDSKTFSYAEYATTQVPTYPCGQIGFLLGSKGGQMGGPQSCQIPVREPDEQLNQTLSCYTPQIHQAAFVLPKFVRDKLK